MKKPDTTWHIALYFIVGAIVGAWVILIIMLMAEVASLLS